MSHNTYSLLLIIISLALTIQGLVAIWQMIYGWIDVERLTRREMPKTKVNPKTFFSIIVPCRHEEEVIAATLQQLLKQNYPKDLFEILVPMTEDDKGTIDEVDKVIDAYPDFTIKKVLFNQGPINKPHGLNVALEEAKGDFIAVFDAEDEVHVKLLEIVNTTILTEGRKIIQTGVSLINWYSNWFTLHGSLEYYFWFNSRLHWYADNKITTLAGVGIFIPREILTALHGWNEKYLTEDAKLGIDCSVAGYEFRVLCEEEYSTKEEVPTDLGSFLKQRTRWIQGFVQILVDGSWMKLSFKKQIYFLMLVVFPFVQVLLYIWITYSLFFAPKLPILIVFLSLIPMGILVFQIGIQIGQMVEMLMLRKQFKFFPIALIIFIITFLPYQLLMAISAVRALIRQLTHNNRWEKTPHINSHRLNPTFAMPLPEINHE